MVSSCRWQRRDPVTFGFRELPREARVERRADTRIDEVDSEAGHYVGYFHRPVEYKTYVESTVYED